MAAIERDLAHDGYYCRSDAEYLLSEIGALKYRLHEARDLLKRVQNYLEHGGFFNPELMAHDKVRELVVDLAEALRAERTEGDQP